MTYEDLDGEYDVMSESLTGKPHTVDGDGTTEIRNGLTYRKDKNGLIWESAFSVVGDNKVQMESTVDPSHTPEPTYLKDTSGNPTSGMQTFRTLLDASFVDSKLVMTGIIEHGEERTRLTMTKKS
ncbi:MAG: hypothetical protein OXT65_06605 [Alphaproteobacteria bacterium]|nr:hypothetical protein [Alphaproteobacteria bacterium]